MVVDILQNLFAEQELCRQFLEASPDAIVVLTPQGEIIKYNNNATELFGYGGVSDIPHNVVQMYCDPSARGKLLSELEREGVVKDFETSLYTRKGVIFANIYVSLFELDENTVHIAVIRDISEKHAAAEKLQKSEEKFAKLFNSASDAILLMDETGRIVDCNWVACKFFAVSKNQLLESGFLELSPQVQPGGRLSKELFFSAMAEVLGGKTLRLLWQNVSEGGVQRDTNIVLNAVEVDGETLVLCVVFDLSEQQKTIAKGRLDELRFKVLSTMSRMTDAPLDAIYDYALEAAVSITASEIGYIYYVSEDEAELKIHAWSRGVMPQCSVDKIPDSYRVEQTGIWGDAVRLRQPIITNDYAGCPHKKGLPEGHVPIARHMNIPVFDGDRIVLLVGVGNKDCDYTQEDVQQLTMLMEGMWNVVRRKEADDALRDVYEGFEQKFYVSTGRLSSALDKLRKKNNEINLEIESHMAVEKELRNNASRLALATRSGGLGVWEWDLSNGDLIWDDRMFEIYHCHPEDFDGVYEAWRSRVHVEDLAAAEIVLSDAVECKGLFDWEFRIVWPGGEIRHIKASALAVEDSKGQVQSMIGINQDITEHRRLESRLRLFERIIAVTPDLVALVNADYRYVMVNDSYVKSFGKPREYFVGRHLREVVGTEIFDKYSKPMIDVAFEGEIQSFESWLYFPGFGERFFSVTYQLVNSEQHGECFVAIVAHDITEIKLAEDDRKRIFDLSVDMLGVMDYEGRFLELNPAWKSSVGWSESDLKGSLWIDYIHKDDREESCVLMKGLRESGELRNLENRFRKNNGEWCWILWNLTSDAERDRVTLVGRDVSARKQMVEELQKLACTDGLTGANNRRCFFDRVQGEVERISRYGGQLCLMMLDIDHFKLINDSFGHDAGDKVLQELVYCVRDALRTSDIFGRIGGEEFAILLVQGDVEGSLSVAERLRSELSGLQVVSSDAVIRFTVSIGLSWLNPENLSIEEAMKRADRCLYKAKEEGRNMVVSDC